MRAFTEVSEYPHTDVLCRECGETVPRDTTAFRVPGSEHGHYNGHGDYICAACYGDMDMDLGSVDYDDDGNAR